MLQTHKAVCSNVILSNDYHLESRNEIWELTDHADDDLQKNICKLNSFMGIMHDGTSKKMVEGQQALIDYLQAKLAIFEEKHAEVTGKERPT